ncbi:MAG: glycosyltransferase [Bacteroidales bacterium]|jgi:glycosyltransferase involved in cell wall biosynthesis|nr:glycosyltransferase [Bacteroidales bacterium]
MSVFPLVSVIIPCYNCEKYVKEAIISILNQTYQNLEVIITDDCSTDTTYKILEEIASGDSRIRLFRNDKNKGVTKTLNAMLDEANGTYIARMDADDISLPKRIEEQVKFLQTHPDYGICGCSVWHIDKDGKKIGKSLLPFSNSDIQYYKIFSSPFYHPAVMIISSLILKERYDENFLCAQDYELWIRLLKKTKAENLPKILFCYRFIETSISGNRHTKRIQIEMLKKLQDKSKFCYFTKIKNNKAKAGLTSMILRSKIWIHDFSPLSVFSLFSLFIYYCFIKLGFLLCLKKNIMVND